MAASFDAILTGRRTSITSDVDKLYQLSITFPSREARDAAARELEAALAATSDGSTLHITKSERRTLMAMLQDAEQTQP